MSLHLPTNEPTTSNSTDTDMPNKDNFHTVPTEEGWGVKREGNSRNSANFSTQQEAWDYTRDRARSEGGEAFLHGTNGKIRERNTYPRSRDNYPPKG